MSEYADDEDDSAFMPAPDIWIETRHELPPSHEPVRTKCEAPKGSIKRERDLAYCPLAARWFDDETHEVPRPLTPTHWRHLSDEEKR